MTVQVVSATGCLFTRSFLFLFLSLFAISGCVTEPITGRKKLALIPEESANSMGLQAYQQMLSQAKVSADPELGKMLQRVGSRIARVTDNRMAAEGRELYKWEFTVIDDSKTINAWALPGGKVAFYSGIFPIAQNDAGIAVVMGHEVAHAYAQHGRSRVSQEVVAEFGLDAVQSALSNTRMSPVAQKTLAALGVGAYQLGIALPFSRSDESAADQIGLTLMAEAGYDPREAVAFWQRMEATSGGQGPPEFLSTHPSHGSRIARIKELLPNAIKIYEKSRAGPAENQARR